jgi:hypothetical protein
MTALGSFIDALNCYNTHQDLGSDSPTNDRNRGRVNGTSRTGKILASRLDDDQIKRRREVAMHNVPDFENIPNDVHHRFQNETVVQQHHRDEENVTPHPHHHIPHFHGARTESRENINHNHEGFQHSLRWTNTDVKETKGYDVGVLLKSLDTLPDDFQAKDSEFNPRRGRDHTYSKLKESRKHHHNLDETWAAIPTSTQQAVHQPKVNIPVTRYEAHEPVAASESGSPKSLGFY